MDISNPNNGFISSVWGPSAWFFIHCVALNFPLQPTRIQRSTYRRWFESLGTILPCGACRRNFQSNLISANYNPRVDFASRMQFYYLTYRLHNVVRKQQGKSTTLSYEDSVLLYEQFRARDCTTKGNKKGSCRGKVPLTCTMLIKSSEDENCRFKTE